MGKRNLIKIKRTVSPSGETVLFYAIYLPLADLMIK